MALLIALLLAPLTLLTLCLAVELIVGLRRLPPAARRTAGEVTAAIIVPAHNEAAIVRDTLAALKEEAGDHAMILLVADNCTDSTAEIARLAGVEVLERLDPSRRGKGFALDFARQHLSTDPPDIVLIVDADCFVESGAVTRLIAASAASGRPCQAVYLQRPVGDAEPALQLSTFAFFIKNVVRQRALQRLAGRIHLLGTGMALPWPLFDQSELATGNIVEDLEMGLELAQAGHLALLVEDAVVWSDAASKAGTIAQRQRWEGGYLQGAARWGPRLFAESVRRADLRGIWAAISLFVPPVAMLVLLDLAALAVAGTVARLTGADVWPLLTLAVALIVTGVGLVAAWVADGHRFIGVGGLARIPLYLAWKVPMYLGFARKGAPKAWVRTTRDEV